MKGLSLWSGIIALIIGLFLFIHPFTTTAMIGWIIAIIIFLSGFTSLFMYSSSVNRSLWYLLQGILSIVFGIILLSSSVMSLSSAVMTIVAYWILISGILRLIGGFQMKKAGFFDANRFLGSAVLAILLGIFLLFNPTLSAIFVGRLAGLLLVAVGVSGISFSFKLYSTKPSEKYEGYFLAIINGSWIQIVVHQAVICHFFILGTRFSVVKIRID